MNVTSNKSRSARIPLRTSASAFTLIELLVVISIIALLVSILLPALASARKAAQDSQCKSNIRQGAQAMYMYAMEDSNDFMPMLRMRFPGPIVYWYEQVNRYANQQDKKGFGWDYLRCPSQEEDCASTYGVNYHGSNPSYGGVFYYDSGTRNHPGPRLGEIDNSTYILADRHNRDWGNGASYWSLIYTPRNWGLNTDWDQDGLNDSFYNGTAFIDTAGPYNGFGAWHMRAGNMAFGDGHAETITLIDYITNKNDEGLWGGP